MRTFQVKIKPIIAKSLDCVTDTLTITQDDLFVVCGKLWLKIKGAKTLFPKAYINFRIDEVIFENE